MAKKVYRVQNDDGPPLTFQLEGVDVTGWSASAFIRREQGDLVTLTGAITAALTGEFAFPFAAGDLSVAGEHELEFQLTDNLGDKQTWPQDKALLLVVREELD